MTTSDPSITPFFDKNNQELCAKITKTGQEKLKKAMNNISSYLTLNPVECASDDYQYFLYMAREEISTALNEIED